MALEDISRRLASRPEVLEAIQRSGRQSQPELTLQHTREHLFGEPFKSLEERESKKKSKKGHSLSPEKRAT